MFYLAKPKGSNGSLVKTNSYFPLIWHRSIDGHIAKTCADRPSDIQKFNHVYRDASVQSQKAVSVYFSSEQILPFDFAGCNAWQLSWLIRPRLFYLSDVTSLQSSWIISDIPGRVLRLAVIGFQGRTLGRLTQGKEDTLTQCWFNSVSASQICKHGTTPEWIWARILVQATIIYSLCFGLVLMAISTDSKPTIYREFVREYATNKRAGVTKISHFQYINM